MKQYLLMALAVWAFMALPGCSSQPPTHPLIPRNADGVEVITLPVGAIEIRELDFEPGQDPSVGNKLVMQVEAGHHKKQLRLIPLKKGSTAVVIFDRNGKLREKRIYNIVTNDLSQKTITIRALLKSVDGITVETLDDRIVIDGRLEDEDDRERVLQVQAAYYDVVLNLAVPEPNLCATRQCWTNKADVSWENLSPLPPVQLDRIPASTGK